MNETLTINIKIGGTQQATNDIKSLSAGLKGEMDKLKKNLSLDNIGSFNTFKSGLSDIGKGIQGLSKQAAVAGAAIGTALAGAAVYSAKSFIDFEDQLVNVAKTIGLTAEGTKKLGAELLAYSKTTRTSVSSLIDIATIGGQLGVAEADVLGFAKAMDKLSVALGDEFAGGAQQITQEVGVMRNLFLDIKTDKIDVDLLKIGNALNVLGTKGVVTGSVVSDFATRIAGLTGGLGVSAGDILGLSAAMQNLGINAERGGSNIGRVFMALARDSDNIAKKLGLNVKDFKKLVNSDINEAFLLVARRVNELGTSNTTFSKILEDIGLDASGTSEVMQKLGGSIGMVNEFQQIANETLKETNSIIAEYDLKNNTTRAGLDKLGNAVNAVAVEVGSRLAPYISKLADRMIEVAVKYGPALSAFFEEKLIPAVKKVIEFLAPVVQGIIEFVKQNPFVIELGLAFAALSLAVSIFSTVFGPATQLLLGFGKIAIAAIANIPALIGGINSMAETITGSSNIFAGAFKLAFANIAWGSIAGVVAPVFGVAFALIVGYELGKWLAEQKWFQDLTGYTATIDSQKADLNAFAAKQEQTIKEFDKLRNEAAQRDGNLQATLATIPPNMQATKQLLAGFIQSDFKSLDAYIKSTTTASKSAMDTVMAGNTGIGIIANITKGLAQSASNNSSAASSNADRAVAMINGISPVVRDARENAAGANTWAWRISNQNLGSVVAQINSFVPNATKDKVQASPLFTGLRLIGSIFGLRFAQGGIVPGGAYSGDKVVARVNSGEMILNRDQQSSLFKMINKQESNKTVNINGVNFMQSQANPAQQMLSFTNMISQAI